MGVPILTSQRYEADDVIGTLARRRSRRASRWRSSPATRTSSSSSTTASSVYNPKEEGTWYDAAGVKEKFGVAPEQVVDVLALMGDSIDNIKGVPGHRRERRARSDRDVRRSLDNLLAHAAEVTNKRQREGLLDHADDARQSRELARIRVDCPVDFDPESHALPRRLARALLRAVLAAGLPHAGDGVRADRADRRQGLPGGRHDRGRRGAGRRACARPGASRCACCPTRRRRCARRSSGCRFRRRRARRATCRSVGHRGSGSTAASHSRAAARSTRSRAACSRIRRSGRSATT